MLRQIHNLTETVSKNPWKLRLGSLTILVVPILLPLLQEITKSGQHPLFYTLEWAMVAAFVMLFVEVLIGRCMAAANKPMSSVLLATSQLALLKGTPPHWADIDASDEVRILSDTLKSFTDNQDNLDALKRLRARDGRLHVLLMSPTSNGLKVSARARSELGRLDTAASLSHEVLGSLRRLCSTLGAPCFHSCVRLYDYPAYYASYIFGKAAFLTMFTYGRGGSSPSFYLPASGGHDAMLQAYRKAFDETWGAASTKIIDDAFWSRLNSSDQAASRLRSRSPGELKNPK